MRLATGSVELIKPPSGFFSEQYSARDFSTNISFVLSSSTSTSRLKSLIFVGNINFFLWVISFAFGALSSAVTGCLYNSVRDLLFVISIGFGIDNSATGAFEFISSLRFGFTDDVLFNSFNFMDTFSEASSKDIFATDNSPFEFDFKGAAFGLMLCRDGFGDASSFCDLASDDPMLESPFERDGGLGSSETLVFLLFSV